MGVLSILLADGSRDDGLGHSSFAVLVHLSPFASVSIVNSSGRSCSGHQRLHLIELGFEGQHFRVVVIGGVHDHYQETCLGGPS